MVTITKTSGIIQNSPKVSTEVAPEVTQVEVFGSGDEFDALFLNPASSDSLPTEEQTDHLRIGFYQTELVLYRTTLSYLTYFSKVINSR